MKKRMIFNPAWNPRLKVWIHRRIEKISKKENFCSTCESDKRCPILHSLAEIKSSNKIDFIITRCGFYRKKENFCSTCESDKRCPISASHDISNKLQNQLKKETHYNNPDVWVNPSSEELRKTQCMCRAESCRKLNLKNSEKNCSIANQLFKICKEYDVAMLIFQCPDWNNARRKVKSFLISL